jgi:hypothetical protein
LGVVFAHATANRIGIRSSPWGLMARAGSLLIAPSPMPKKPTKGDRAAAKVFREFKAGTLNTGKPGPGKGPKVKSRKQAIAIALSEKERANRPKRKRKG